MKRLIAAGALFAANVLFVATALVHAQQPTSTTNTTPQNPPPGSREDSLDDKIAAGDEEIDTPERDLVKWNHYEGKYFSVRLGGGFLYDFVAFAQDADSKQQFQLDPKTKIRDARFVLKGRFKFLPERDITWSLGLMYDPPTNKFLYRETGVMFKVPELSGYIFVGRTKEGFSLNKVMVGYAGWTMERAPISDATIPILADGVKWLGYIPEKHLLWNVGYFNDFASEGQTFSTYAHQFVGRFMWVPMESEETGRVFHIGLNLRYGIPDDKKLQLRSRPEAFPAPYFVDTGVFPANNTKMTALEVYYRPGSLLIGSEYFLQKVGSPSTGNPFFNGGSFVVSWLPTGEVRQYNTKGGFFNGISPRRPVFQGGPGAWELVANFTYTDLDSGPIHGGRFWRFTPMVNWHMSDNLRLEAAYGLGSLDRFNLTGNTQFFQARVQLQF